MFSFRKSTARCMMIAVIAVLVLSSVVATPVYAVAPVVVSVVRTDPSATTASGAVDFDVTFSVPVIGVDILDFALSAGSIADAAVTNVLAHDGGTLYTVTVTTGTGSGTVGLDVPNTATIQDDNTGDPLVVGWTNVDPYNVQNPTVQSIALVSASPTSKNTVQFAVTFSNPVEGVNVGTLSDFVLAGTGATGASINTVTGSGASYTVTVTTGPGNGTLGLNLSDDDSIHGPNAGRVLGGTGTGNGDFTGALYTMKKIPVLKTPAGTVYDTTPMFQWTPIPQATKYRFEVFKGATKVYTSAFVLPSACTATVCKSTPATNLPPAAYKWHAQAFSDGTWKLFSAFKNFSTAVGFNSQFNGSAAGWVQRPGAPWTVNSSYYGTNNITGKDSSASYNKNFANFTFQARMKRVGVADGSGGESGLVVRGTPLFNTFNDWKTGYYFVYSPYYRGFFVAKAVNGVFTTLKPRTLTPSVVQNNWNTLKVVANGTSLKFYINNTLVWSGTSSGPTTGQVALWSWGGTHPNRLDVDWATLLATGVTTSDLQMDEAVESGQMPLPSWLPHFPLP